MSGVVRLGIIGAGAVVTGYHLPVITALDNLRVDWITDLDAARASQVAKRHGIGLVAKNMTDAPDVDIVLVATPVGSRPEILATVASRRWHAFCEKPFAATVDDHERIVKAMTTAGRRAGIGLVRRFYASTQIARDLVASEILGPVEAVLAGEGARARKFGRGEWYLGDVRASGGGIFSETGSHLVDQVFTIAGAERAEVRHCRQEHVNGLEMDTRLVGTVTLAKGNAVPLTIGVSRLHDLYNGIVVRCRHGEIRTGLGPEDGVDLYDRTGMHKLGTLPGAAKPGIYTAMRGEWVHFLQACEAMDLASDTGLATTRFIAQAYARATVTPRNGAHAQESVQ